jgi:hypothetical protein
VKSEVDIRAKEQLFKKGVNEIEEMWKSQNLKLASKNIVGKCARNVLRCTKSRRKVISWDRDVNATRILPSWSCCRVGFQGSSAQAG